jgi:hypothetical protein
MSRRMSAGTEFMDIFAWGGRDGEERPALRESELKQMKSNKHGHRCGFGPDIRLRLNDHHASRIIQLNYNNHDIVLYMTVQYL